MFFYRDAQYHRIGVNLHQVPGEARIQPFFSAQLTMWAVNCPFMASSYSSLNFDGPLRVDANHGMNPQYAPNSFAHKFRPDASEAPYQVADNTVSRKSQFYHEGRVSEYDQPRALYQRVMNDQARARLHSNTAWLLCLVEYPEIQVKYLAQVHTPLRRSTQKGSMICSPRRGLTSLGSRGNPRPRSELEKRTSSSIVWTQMYCWGRLRRPRSIIPESVDGYAFTLAAVFPERWLYMQRSYLAVVLLHNWLSSRSRSSPVVQGWYLLDGVFQIPGHFQT
jgi:hypothetical protein